MLGLAFDRLNLVIAFLGYPLLFGFGGILGRFLGGNLIINEPYLFIPFFLGFGNGLGCFLLGKLIQKIDRCRGHLRYRCILLLVLGQSLLPGFFFALHQLIGIVQK